MKTLDLKKDLKAFYKPSAKKVEFIEVPRFQFLMVDGAIEPGMEPGNSPLFEENMQAMYGMAYTLKFTFFIFSDTMALRIENRHCKRLCYMQCIRKNKEGQWPDYVGAEAKMP